ncbi:MAG TPA: plastocyanin/azurin family copper-binding protein [Alphaproteobacteria bacterium]|nr:plastocyanin/azurin family copper-binding protein [Alphaproteobacteria bacterium]
MTVPSAFWPHRLIRSLSPAAWTRIFGILGVVIGWQLGGAALAAQSKAVVQKNRAFNFKRITVEAGDVVQFVNDDDFIHQVFVDSPDFSFDTAESPPGNTLSIPFKVKGTFEVHCHIHPKMQLIVNVI